MSLIPARIATARAALSRAEKASGDARRTELTQLGSQLSADVEGSGDQARVRLLVTAVTDLANAAR